MSDSEKKPGSLPWLGDSVELLNLSLRLQLGKRFWMVPFLTLLWPLFLSFQILMGWETGNFSPEEAQNTLIGLPLYILAIGLGIQIISSEIEKRTLEVCYTVPGGARRIWLSKLSAALALVLAAEVLLAGFSAIFFTPVYFSALYGAFQGSVFYMVLGMSFGALFGNKLTAGISTGFVLGLNAVATDFGGNPSRYSPIFNPLGLQDSSMAGLEILAWTIQNHIGIALLVFILIVLTFSRTERRELLLSGD